jgi:hypothetical protein
MALNKESVTLLAAAHAGSRDAVASTANTNRGVDVEAVASAMRSIFEAVGAALGAIPFPAFNAARTLPPADLVVARPLPPTGMRFVPPLAFLDLLVMI